MSSKKITIDSISNHARSWVIVVCCVITNLSVIVTNFSSISVLHQVGDLLFPPRRLRCFGLCRRGRVCNPLNESERKRKKRLEKTEKNGTNQLIELNITNQPANQP
jgi:hypothetical protein